MSLKIIVPAVLVLASAMPAVHAMDADDHNSDVRLEVILLPEPYDFDTTASGGLTLNGNDDFDQPFRIGLAAMSHRRGGDNGPIGLVTGGALNYSRLPIDHNNVSERYEALSAQIRLGLGIYLGDIFHVEATPFAGIGAARGKINDAESDLGLYWEYGLSGGAFVSLGGTAQLGVIAGWLHGEYDLDFDDNANFVGPVDDVNVQLTHEGFFIGAALGARF